MLLMFHTIIPTGIQYHLLNGTVVEEHLSKELSDKNNNISHEFGLFSIKYLNESMNQTKNLEHLLFYKQILFSLLLVWLLI